MSVECVSAMTGRALDPGKSISMLCTILLATVISSYIMGNWILPKMRTHNQMFDIFSFNDLHFVTTPGCVDTQPTRHTPGMLATCVTQCPGFRHGYFGNATGSKGLRFEIGFRWEQNLNLKLKDASTFCSCILKHNVKMNREKTRNWKIPVIRTELS